ncbi:Pyruvate dehydrogenase E1 component subunit alpha [Dermatophilus congolensis]|uniref:Pyruvate dehydrogenase E1 component subunit alpha n=1 Tax=Dermatophilus congolensis TaxID=1863 RepID=A0A239VIS6_9MICO|nr:pyruvate dehydrogenase (acetyl-transferring) E1 component subunit alpha [Dermatophilus congolensis]SNV21504.1 Pyruvate dehydrogenase E1 component subunit alpha [Dermatophilus congolensis]
MTTTHSLTNIDLAHLVTTYAEDFPIIQVLDETGTIVDPQAAQKIDDTTLVQLMKDLQWAKTFDVRITMLNRQGTLANYAPGGGQEASQFATLAALDKGDFLVPTYRDIAPLIKHGLPMWKAFLWWRGHVEGNTYEPEFQAWTPQVIVGGSIPHAAGVALGKKKKGDNHVVMAYCGDGATSQGDFYEGLNFAGVYKAPLIVVVQNNQWAISTPLAQQTAAATIAQKGVAAGIPSLRIDGNDPIALYLAVKQAREYALAGNGPVLIEALTYRTGAHTMSDDPKRYREDDEVDMWTSRSAVTRLATHLTSKNLWNEDMANHIDEQVKAEVKQAVTDMGKIPAQKVSTFLTNMYENPPQNITEQIAVYQAKENN